MTVRDILSVENPAGSHPNNEPLSRYARASFPAGASPGGREGFGRGVVFTKDSRTENFLTQMGVEFRYTNAVSFSELANAWSETNIGRPVPKREEAILEYAALMENGSAAPAPILHGTDHGYDVLDGVQRLAAAELAGNTKLSAYIVTCDSLDMLAAIRVLSNARLQGRPEPPEWTRRRAVEILVVQRGLTAAEVARMGGWKTADVEKTARTLDWSNKIQDIGGPDDLSDAMIEVIAKRATHGELAAAPGPIAEFLRTIKRAKLAASDADEFMVDFFRPVSKASKVHEIYSSRLEQFRQDPEIVTRVLGRRGVGMRQDVNLRRLLKAASGVLDEIVASDDPLLYVDEFFQLLNGLKDQLHRISKKHDKPVTAPTPADMWSAKR